LRKSGSSNIATLKSSNLRKSSINNLSFHLLFLVEEKAATDRESLYSIN
jgi:hypothetical protein